MKEKIIMEICCSSADDVIQAEKGVLTGLNSIPIYFMVG